MATVKVKVIGPVEVAGINPGGTGSIDDELVNVQALIDAEHVEVLVEKEPEEKPVAKKAAASKKGDD